MQALNREDDDILLDFENITDLVINIIALLRQQNKKSQRINDVNKAKVDRQINSNYQFTFDLDPMEEIEEDINTMVENNVAPKIPEDFVPPFALKTEEIKKQTKQEGENFVQASLMLREAELRAADKIVDEENKGIIESVVDPTPGLLVNDETDFQDINFPPNTTDNTYKLQPKIKKHVDEMVIDAVQPNIEQDLYTDEDFDSFMIVDDDEKVKNNDNVIDVKPENEQVKNSVNEKTRISPPKD